MATNHTTEEMIDCTELCRRMAGIRGPSSGAAQAMAKYNELAADGKRSIITWSEETWWVRVQE